MQTTETTTLVTTCQNCHKYPRFDGEVCVWCWWAMERCVLEIEEKAKQEARAELWERRNMGGY